MAIELLNGLIAHWRADESSGNTLYDVSNNYNLTLYLNPSLNYAGVVNTCIDIDSSRSNTYNNSTAPFDNVSDNFSVSFWVYPHRIGLSGDRYYFRTMHGSSPWYSLTSYNQSNSSNLVFRVRDACAGDYSATATINASTWYHVVGVVEGIGKYIKLYVNDVSSRSSNTLAKNILDHNQGFNFGNGYNGSAEGAYAALDEMTMWSRALNEEEIAALYNSGSGLAYPFVEDTSIIIDLSTGLQGYWKLDENTGSTLYDSVGVNHLTNSNAIIGAADAISGRSVEFDTSTDYIRDSTLTGLDASNDQFSVSLWAKFDVSTTGSGINMTLLRIQEYVSGGVNRPVILLNTATQGGNDYLAAYISSIDGSIQSIETTPSKVNWQTNTWYHIAYTYAGAGNLGTLYVNASDARGWTNNKIFTQPISSPMGYITLGNSYGGARLGLDGKIDEFGYWNRALTPAEVSTLYNNGQGLTFPFTGPVIPDLSTGLNAYWKFDETSGTTAYDSLNTYDLTNTGAIINSDGKIETSYLFEGGSDRVTNDTSILWNTRMTVGAWIKSTYTAGYQNVISTYRYSTYAYGYDLNIRNSGAEFALRGGINGNRAVDVNVSGINDGNWHHVIGTWDGSTIRLYVDASLRGTNSWTYDVQYIPTCYFSIGNRAGSIPFNGNIDEPFVYNRAITPAEVSALYNNGLGLSYPFTETPGPVSAPTVTTTSITDISIHTATGGGNVTHDGSIALTYRGICWGTSTNPTVADSSVQDGATGEGSYISYLTNLISNTTYYVRAFAYNSEGLSYGNNVNFTTESGLTAPVVTTAGITDVSLYTATSGGTVVDDGGSTITARGICWDTTSNPTIASGDGSTGNGTGEGTFVSYLTNLTPATYYYVRAYAINSQGTSYGSNIGFTTNSRTLLTDLVSYWKLDEESGTVYDSFGTNNGTVTGATYSQTGKINTGLYFDAANEIINCGTGTSLRITEEITLSAWIKLSATQNTYPRIVGKESGYGMYVSSVTGNLRWYDGVNDVEVNSISSFDLRDNSWHLVTTTYDKTAIRGYVDASPVGTFSYTGSLTDVPAIPLTIGNRVAGDRYTVGTIDEVGIWSRALSPNEISQLYNADRGLTYPFTSTLINALGVYNGFFVTYMGQTVWVFSL